MKTMIYISKQLRIQMGRIFFCLVFFVGSLIGSGNVFGQTYSNTKTIALPSTKILRLSKIIVILHHDENYELLVDIDSLRAYLPAKPGTVFSSVRGRLDSLPLRDTVNLFDAASSSVSEQLALTHIAYDLLVSGRAFLINRKTKKFMNEAMTCNYSDVGTSGKMVFVGNKEFLKVILEVW